MRRYFLSIALGALCSVGPAYAATCPSGVNPAINIATSESQPRFDYTLTQKAMEKYAGDAAVYDLTVNAMSTGKMRINHNLTFTTNKTANKKLCLQVAQVNVHIHVDPVIYIAKELRDDACEYKEYLIHELKHVEEDRRLIADYKAIIMRNMAFAFPTVRDYSVGPVTPDLSKNAQQKLSDNVAGTLQATFDSMLRERRERQRQIDSTGEYLRLSVACGEGGAGVKPELRKP